MENYYSIDIAKLSSTLFKHYTRKSSGSGVLHYYWQLKDVSSLDSRQNFLLLITHYAVRMDM